MPFRRRPVAAAAAAAAAAALCLLAPLAQGFVLPSAASSKARPTPPTTPSGLAAAATEAKAAGFTVTDVKNGVYEQIKANPDLKLPDQFQQALTDILDGMTSVAETTGLDPVKYKEMLGVLLKEAADNSRDLYQFDPFHKNIRGPGTDFTKFGETWFDILIVRETSAVLGKHNMQKIVDYVRQGHNVVLLANHQTEPDPYILRAAFKRIIPEDDPILDKLVFVAGAKVRTDLFTIPFSKGLNLICIHSKKYIEDDPATKPLKIQENLAAMKVSEMQLTRDSSASVGHGALAEHLGQEGKKGDGGGGGGGSVASCSSNVSVGGNGEDAMVLEGVGSEGGSVVQQPVPQTPRSAEAYVAAVDGVDYQSLFNQVSTPLAVAGVDGRFVDANARFQMATGYGKEELAKLTLFNLVAPEELQATFGTVARMLNQPGVGEPRFTRRALAKGQPSRGQQGQGQGQGQQLYITVSLVRQSGAPQFFQCSLH